MGYFKVGYQKMVTMAESSNNFHMHHYQQMAKGRTQADCDLYFKMSCDRGPPGIASNRSEKSHIEPREDPAWLAAYSFNLHYVKGRDMIMADYLSHHWTKDSDTSELVPISFCPMTTYYRCLEENAYCIGTRASTKVAGEVAPKVHGADKPLDPNLKPEHQSKSTRANVAQNQTSQQSGPSKQPSLTVQPDPTPVSSVHHGGARPKGSSTVLPPRRVLVPPYVQPAAPSPFSRGFKPRPPVEKGEDVDDEKIKYITTKYARVLNPKPIPGIDTGAEEEVLDPEI